MTGRSLDSDMSEGGADEDEPVSDTLEGDAFSKARLRERRSSGRLSSSSLMLDEAFLADAGSDSSEDERPDRNTIGAVPLEWYNEEEHIGYNR